MIVGGSRVAVVRLDFTRSPRVKGSFLLPCEWRRTSGVLSPLLKIRLQSLLYSTRPLASSHGRLCGSAATVGSEPLLFDNRAEAICALRRLYYNRT